MKFEKLGNIAEVIAGQSPPSTAYNKTGEGVPFFQGKADYGKKYPVVRSWTTEVTKTTLPNDILISVRAPVGPVNINNIEACIGRGLSAIRVNKDISFEYVYFYLKANEKEISSLGVGSTFTAITQKTLSSIKIPLPNSLQDQRRIATILSKAEALIAQRKQSIALLDDYLKSTFLDIFGDPVRNEKGWEKVPLKKISEIQGGLQVTHKREVNKIELPYLRVANVYRNFLDLSIVKTMKVTHEEVERIRLKKDDILIVEGHGNPNEIGRSAIWDDTISNCLHQNHLIRVRVDSKKTNPNYVNYFINSSSGKQQMFKAGNTTSGLNTISTKIVKETIINYPPLPLQNQFAAIVQKVELLKNQYQQSLVQLQALFGSLSQLGFKGELNLKEGTDYAEVVEIPEEENTSTEVIPINEASIITDYTNEEDLLTYIEKESFLSIINDTYQNKIKKLISLDTSIPQNKINSVYKNTFSEVVTKIDSRIKLDKYQYWLMSLFVKGIRIIEGSDNKPVPYYYSKEELAICERIVENNIYSFENYYEYHMPSFLTHLKKAKKKRTPQINLLLQQTLQLAFAKTYTLILSKPFEKMLLRTTYEILSREFQFDFTKDKQLLIENFLGRSTENIEDASEDDDDIGQALPWNEMSYEQIANWLKKHYKNNPFSQEMGRQYLLTNHISDIDYYSSEELKRKPRLNESEDFKAFIFSAISHNNPFIKLQQFFYDAEAENEVLKLKKEDYALIKDKPKKERSGIYFKIIED